ncbi:MAG: hypothetical protein HUU38_23090 [Anaerolineales bacterium]|nr:hypothetical protein [Anaerolineales bacterium]
MTRDCGILLLGQDDSIKGRARQVGVQVELGAGPDLCFEKTLIVAPGTRVPWHLLEAAWKLLDRWDAAVPLWQYTVTAETIGNPVDRDRTRAVIRDLRVLLHATELLFIRANEAGRALAEKWSEDVQDGGDPRLAFLRALYLVKPHLYVLPVSWLLPERSTSRGGARGAVPRHTQAAQRTLGQLTRVEISPGQFVKCHPGDESRVIDMLRRGRG